MTTLACHVLGNGSKIADDLSLTCAGLGGAALAALVARRLGPAKQRRMREELARSLELERAKLQVRVSAYRELSAQLGKVDRERAAAAINATIERIGNIGAGGSV